MENSAFIVRIFNEVKWTGSQIKDSSLTELFIMKLHQLDLKGRFSSGIEGILASTLNHDFNWIDLIWY